MSMHNFFFIRLFTRQTKGKKTLVDYSQSHVVTSYQNLNIMWKKTMDKTTAIEIKENK
jgi:hypothetical protein